MQREFKVSLSPSYYSETIRLSQYDANYPLIITVYDKTAQASINGMAAYFEGTRSDGLSFRYSGTAVESKIQFTIDTALTAVAGKHTGEIVLYDGSGLWFGSANVQIFVEKAARPDNAIDADVEEARAIAEQIQEIVDTAAETTTAATQQIVGDLTEELSIVTEGLNDVEDSIGDLSNLITSAKDNLVSAVNEAAQTGGSGGTAQKSLPKLYINGDISQSSKDFETKAYNYVFVDEDGKRHYGFNSLKWQGESSLSYPKKNYTLKFFHDALYKRKDKVDLLPLGIKKSKFVIKANWIDRSMARNIVSCRLWGRMVKSRHNDPPELLAASPNHGAIDGYPINVYVNGTFHGLYSFNIPKDEDLFGMDAENPLHCVVCGDNNQNTDNNSAAFRTATIGNGNWELEVPDAWQTYDVEEEGQTVTHAVKDNLSSTIAFVINSTDEEFVEGINDHIDLESAIDYFLLMFMDCGVDSAARNLIMLTYDGGNKWYCSAYDKDMTWGNGPTGTPKYNAQTACPAGYINTNSLLWERLTELFGDAIWDRWVELRNTILSPTNIKAEFDYFWQDITDADYAADVTAWPTMPQATIDFKARMFSFIEDRWTYMDAQINAMRQPVPCTGISLDQTSITFADSTPVTLVATLEPANTTDPVVWTSSNASVASVSNGVVTPTGNGTATITATCGNYSVTCAVTVSGMSYTVTLSGIGVTLSPTEDVVPNAPYTGTLTADTGYEIRSVVVTMGGTDITATAYSNGTITIASVTGNIVVTSETAYSYDETGLQYRLTSPLVMDGERYVDTGFAYDATSALTIAIDLVEPNDVTTAGRFILGAMRSSTYTAGWETSYRSFKGINNRNVLSGLAATANQRVRAVLRYNPDTNVMSVRSSADDALLGTVEKTNANSHGAGASSNVTRDAFVNSMYVGGLHGADGLTNATDSGTVNDLRIYTRRWTDAEVKQWLGVESLSDVFTDDKDA